MNDRFVGKLRVLRPRRSWWGWAIAIVVMVAFGLTMATRQPINSAFDVDSNEPMGTRALVMLLERFGGTVSVDNQPHGDTAILFRDDLTQTETSTIARWVREGGTLIVADPMSSFLDAQIGGANAFRQPHHLTPQCDSELTMGVERIEPQRHNSYDVFEREPFTTSCFPATGGSFMTESRLDSGRVVALGSGTIFTNGQLGEVDNSVLAMNLLLSSESSTITVLETRDVTTSGDEELGDLIPESVNALIWQITIAGVLLMLWRARRVGKPITEPQQVELPGSQLTVAVGNLMQNAGQIDGAAQILRADLRRSIGELIGMNPNTDIELLAAAVSERTGVDKTLLLYALIDRPVASSRDLVDLAQTIEGLHREVSNAR